MPCNRDLNRFLLSNRDVSTNPFPSIEHLRRETSDEAFKVAIDVDNERITIEDIIEH